MWMDGTKGEKSALAAEKMGKFWDYLYWLPEPINWIFTVNHLYLIAFVVALILFLYFVLPSKNEKAIRITFLVLGLLVAVLEILRIVWAYGFHTAMNAPIDAAFWWWTISFQICAISAWSTVLTMIGSSFLRKNHPAMQFMYPILLGVSLVGAALAFIYPDMIEEMKPFFHFRNIQTIVTHTLIIFSPLYFIKTGRYVVKMNDLWKVAVGWFSAICISMSASLISGQCFGFALNCNLMEAIGLVIPFPFHLIFLGVIMMAISWMVFWLSTIRSKHKSTKFAGEIRTIPNPKLYHASTLLFITSGIIGLASLFAISLWVEQKTWWGLAALLPIPLTGFLISFGFKIRERAKKATGSPLKEKEA